MVEPLHADPRTFAGAPADLVVGCVGTAVAFFARTCFSVVLLECASSAVLRPQGRCECLTC